MKNTPDAEKDTSKKDKGLMVVGVGASAGGLQAYKDFLEALPSDPDMAFVLILHLDPDHKSMMSELLQRHTKLEVRQVTERIKLQPNTIHVIPPGKYLELNDDFLTLSEAPHRAGFRTPIDHFFRTLAEVKGERAICIVLSGTGSDGTLGLKAVKASGGLALVQAPESATHDGMPQSAIRTGAVDRILKLEEMPEVLMQYAQHPYVTVSLPEKQDHSKESNESKEKGINGILNILQVRTGHEFRGYKKSTVSRRVERRMSVNRIEDMNLYMDLLREDEEEVTALFQDLLIGVTSFFREPEAWQALEEKVLPTIIARCDRDRPLRIWAPGCSSGEEPYSLAILVLEALERTETACEVQIFATDIDPISRERAREGRYPCSIAAQVSPERLETFFERQGDTYTVRREVRDCVVFAPQSLIKDPPFSRLDLVICRNLLIYLENEVQSHIMRIFHFALNDDGYLFLGNSESITNAPTLYKTVDKSSRIYKKKGVSRPGDLQLSFQGHTKKGAASTPSIPSQRNLLKSSTPGVIAKDALLERFAPASVLVNEHFEILYYHGPTGDYLSQPQGEPTRNVLEMIPSSIRAKLRAKLLSASEEKEAVQFSVRLKKKEHPDCLVKLEVLPLPKSQSADNLTLITFERISTEQNSAENSGESSAAEFLQMESEDQDGMLSRMENELLSTRQELQSTIEELETSNEELKASNEEVMSMNEELQSTNEELETSQEELQSLNEELTTVNNELREKVNELEETNNDLANLLSSTSIATLFLDRALTIKKFTPAVQDLFHVMETDVGRPFGHISSRLDDTELEKDARNVLEELTPIEKEVRNDEGRWFIRRILPYRTLDDRIDGVVITFVDVTTRMEASQKIKESQEQLHRALMNAPLPAMLVAEDGNIFLMNQQWTECSGYDREEVTTLNDWALRAYRKSDFDLIPYMQGIFEKEELKDEGLFTILTKNGEERSWHFHSSPLGNLQDGRRFILIMAIDVTDQVETERELSMLTENLEQQVEKRTADLEQKRNQLRQLSIQMTQTEQKERQRLASNLHDSVQQLLAVSLLNLKNISGGSQERSDELSVTIDSLSEASKLCRDLTTQLAPTILYDNGLRAALSWLCDWFEDKHGLRISNSIETEQEPSEEEYAILIFQSVRELLFNVRKHSGVDVAEIRYTAAEKGFLQIDVIDRGDGFNMDHPEFAEQKGFGLFSIGERFKHMGGKMTIDSEEGKGTKISLFAPSQPSLQLSHPEESTSAATKSPTTPRQREGAITMVIVDDHDLVRKGLSQLLLSESGKEVHVIGEAKDGREAIEVCRNLHPELVLMDVNMPHLNGIEATKEVVKTCPDTFVLGMSVNAGTGARDPMLQAGAKEFICKDINAAELLSTIKMVCRGTST